MCVCVCVCVCVRGCWHVCVCVLGGAGMYVCVCVCVCVRGCWHVCCMLGGRSAGMHACVCVWGEGRGKGDWRGRRVAWVHSVDTISLQLCLLKVDEYWTCVFRVMVCD